MLLALELLRWWYSDGWRERVRLVATRLDGTIDYFSFDLLLKTLFAPFRQISAGRVNGPIGVQLSAIIDKLFSRLIGAFIRIVILLVGGVTVGLQVVLSVLFLIVWGLVPLMPLMGIGLAMSGWTL